MMESRINGYKGQSTLILGLLGILICLSTVGCGDKKTVSKQEPVDQVNAAAIGADTNIAVKMEAPRLYTDPAKQKRFASLFDEYTAAFVVPTPGTVVRLEQVDGTILDGEFVQFTDRGVVIQVQDGIADIRNDLLTEKTKAELYVEAFSQQLAEKQMVFDAAGGGTADSSSVFFPEVLNASSEARRVTAERLNPRLGPGRQFAVAPHLELFRGEVVYVVDELNGWIAIRVNESDPRAIGWIPKYSTFTTNPENKEKIAKEVESLTKSGFIVEIDPKKNEALVDSFFWRVSDNASVEGISRLLAFYCGQQKGVRLFWVNIKDAKTNRRLAEYSESKGFKVY